MSKKLIWVRNSLECLREFPREVRIAIGAALHEAQEGGKSAKAKAFKGLGSGVLEIVEDHDGDTYRAVYIVRLKKGIYILHAFQKKAKKGIATPKHEVDLIKKRLKDAVAIDEEE